KANPQVDRGMERVILRALSTEPAERFASAKEFAAALRQSLAWSSRARRWLQRNRRKAMAAVVALVATIALGVGVWASQPSVEDQLFARGVQAYEKGNSQTAIDCLTRALELRPQSTELLF